MSNLNLILLFLVFMNFLTLFFLKRSFLMMLMNLELMVIKLFFCLICVLGTDFVFLYIFLALVACESVIGLSVLVKMTRNKSLNKSVISKSLN